MGCWLSSSTHALMQIWTFKCEGTSVMFAAQGDAASLSSRCQQCKSSPSAWIKKITPPIIATCFFAIKSTLNAASVCRLTAAPSVHACQLTVRRCVGIACTALRLWPRCATARWVCTSLPKASTPNNQQRHLMQSSSRVAPSGGTAARAQASSSPPSVSAAGAASGSALTGRSTATSCA